MRGMEIFSRRFPPARVERVRGDANPHARSARALRSQLRWYAIDGGGVRAPACLYSCMRDSDGDGKSYLELHGCSRPNPFPGDDSKKI